MFMEEVGCLLTLLSRYINFHRSMSTSMPAVSLLQISHIKNNDNLLVPALVPLKPLLIPYLMN